MAPDTGPKPARRVDFIDLLRGWALIVMIETHVFNATLTDQITSAGFFQYLKFINGLVAPSFLFASGLAYAVTTRRKIGQYLSLGPALFRQLGRIALIAVIGYMMHIPVFSAHRLFATTTSAEWQSFYQVDILQCIAATLLFLQVSLLVLRSERRLALFTAFAGTLVVLVSPLVWQTDFWATLPWMAAAYMNGLRFSLFPLFPWAAFLLAGVVTGYYYQTAEERSARQHDPAPAASLVRSVCWAGGSAILLGIAATPIVTALYPEHDYWRAGPGFFFLRLGIVMLLAGVLYFGSQREGSWFRSVIILFGRESLLVYVFHLLLIYGDFGTFNLRKEIGGTFRYGEATIMTLLFILLMYFVARAWNQIKRTSPRLKTTANVATVVLIVGMFLLG